MSNKTFIADKATLDKCYNILAADGIYGFIEHNATLASGNRIEYIGLNKNFTPITVTKGGGYSLGDWADFPLIAGNKPYMVKSDGNPDYRLDENDYTKKEDGTDSDVSNSGYAGGAFSWLPKIYKQAYMQGDDRVVKFSMSPRDGFEAVGFIDSDNNELEGVWLPMFYGSIIDGTMKCISGNQPCYSNATAAEKTAIDAFGARAKFFGGPIMETLQDLLIMWGKNTNTQEVYGNGNMSGYDSSLTPTMGVKANAVIGGGQFYGTSDGKSLNKILHSIVLGSWQQWQRDPYTICVNGVLKVSKNYAYSLTADGYSATGVEYDEVTDTSVHYPHKYKEVPGFGAVPEYPFKGSSATGGCDGFWVNKGITAVAFRLGGCYYGTNVGIRALFLSYTATFSYWSIGASVLLLPPVGVAA